MKTISNIKKLPIMEKQSKAKRNTNRLFSLLLLSALSSPIFMSSQAFAHESKSGRFFFTYESNGDDYIAGVGTGVTFKDEDSNFGFQVNSSFNAAEVRADDGFIEDFFAWQASVKFGYFSNISVYGEAGIDLTEALFHDYRYDDDDDHHHHFEDDVDAFVGVGIGVDTGPIKIEAFSRRREIDSRYWEAEAETFSGVQLSINF
ncbi:hypothetical protein [Aliikangiella coralliicola]|uniref:Porin family protein n=1 Tax=Aliikangiella coralliicola TaxID=2592383 RepID=A0A545UJM6_9GAMM|nr:hypothetical protein [Aliikangiella coralliicola]TQV89669.1 hypothetical protein FLL46_01945 [Aliikangiella coralliicola]